MDGYFPTASEFYQDVFGRGSFGGKGIFHIRTFMDTAMRWIPENTVLSHDMLEGCFCGCGYAGDIALYDSETDSFIAQVAQGRLAAAALFKGLGKGRGRGETG